MTIFNHFCGGENIQDCTNKINELYEFGIGTILDYSVEEKKTILILKNKKEIIQTILFQRRTVKSLFLFLKLQI